MTIYKIESDGNLRGSNYVFNFDFSVEIAAATYTREPLVVETPPSVPVVFSADGNWTAGEIVMLEAGDWVQFVVSNFDPKRHRIASRPAFRNWLKDQYDGVRVDLLSKNTKKHNNVRIDHLTFADSWGVE